MGAAAAAPAPKPEADLSTEPQEMCLVADSDGEDISSSSERKTQQTIIPGSPIVEGDRRPRAGPASGETEVTAPSHSNFGELFHKV